LKLLIVGTGKWSQKIEAVCKVSSDRVLVEIISAREFLENNKALNKNLDYYDRIWISTRPIFQLEVLKSISGFSGIVIIEKPYAQNSFELLSLARFVATQPFLTVLSQPWTFSKGWNQFKLLSKSDESSNFKVTRVGQMMHSYLNPVEDWLPHDLNLILDFIDEPTLKFSIVSQAWNSSKDRVAIELLINNCLKFNLDSGFNSTGRIACWESGKWTLDFLKSTINKREGHAELVIEGHPIIDFLMGCDVLTKDKLTRDLYFHAQVMNGLGL